MCLIIASPNGKKPAFDIFEDAASTNRDGIGLAWRVKDKVLFKKGITLDELQQLMDTEVNDQWVAHFRIATIGGKTSELTHPFVVSNDSPLKLEGEADSVLFQNGTFSSWDTELLRACANRGIRIPDGDWSDARAIAVLVSIYGRNILRFCGGSRYLLLSNGNKANPDLATPVWYTGDWKIHAPSGLHFSNGGSSIFHTSSVTTESRSRPFPQATSHASEDASRTGSERSGSTRASTTGRKRGVRSFKGTSPWTFFGPSGAPENDGVAEALNLPASVPSTPDAPVENILSTEEAKLSIVDHSAR